MYLAEDLKHHRKVAVKVLRPELAKSVGATRFEREIKIAARLTHPHILPLHDSGEADGFLYYVMPYIDAAGSSGALRSVAELMVERSRTTHVTPWQIGTLYTRAGDKEKANQVLGKGVRGARPQHALS